MRSDLVSKHLLSAYCVSALILDIGDSKSNVRPGSGLQDIRCPVPGSQTPEQQRGRPSFPEESNVWTVLELEVFSPVFCLWKSKEELKAIQVCVHFSRKQRLEAPMGLENCLSRRLTPKLFSLIHRSSSCVPGLTLCLLSLPGEASIFLSALLGLLLGLTLEFAALEQES